MLNHIYFEQMLKKFNYTSADDMYVSVANNAITPQRIVQRLIDLNSELKKRIVEAEAEEELLRQQKTAAKKKNRSGNGITVRGEDNMLARLSKCCNPVPGDDIIGFITRGRGVSVHRRDCVNVNTELLSDEEKGRLIECEWDTDGAEVYECNLLIKASDRQGLLADVTVCLSELKLQIASLNAVNRNNVASVAITININEKAQIASIVRKLHTIPGVFDVIRA